MNCSRCNKESGIFKYHSFFMRLCMACSSEVESVEWEETFDKLSDEVEDVEPPLGWHSLTHMRETNFRWALITTDERMS